MIWALKNWSLTDDMQASPLHTRDDARERNKNANAGE
jgi:hypothetical protein